MRQDRVPKRFWPVMMGLFCLSVLYDRLVITPIRHKEGMTWLTVVLGVAYTLAGVALVDGRAAKLTILAFCFSGLPMSLGDIERHLRATRNGDDILEALFQKHGVIHAKKQTG